jgi:hypothetical protein
MIEREEWYTFRNFGRDLHVILVQDTEVLKKEHKQDRYLHSRPPFPQTWALGNVEADVSPNIEKVTPGAWDVPARAGQR